MMFSSCQDDTVKFPPESFFQAHSKAKMFAAILQSHYRDSDKFPRELDQVIRDCDIDDSGGLLFEYKNQFEPHLVWRISDVSNLLLVREGTFIREEEEVSIAINSDYNVVLIKK